jgi:hypothetical protein
MRGDKLGLEVEAEECCWRGTSHVRPVVRGRVG